jgi:hypothetical protein
MTATITQYTIPGTYSFSVPSTSAIRGISIGAGGSGASTDDGSGGRGGSGGGGGGGGGCGVVNAASVSNGQTLTIYVGEAGASTGQNSESGFAGGDSYIVANDGTTILCRGGGGAGGEDDGGSGFGADGGDYSGDYGSSGGAGGIDDGAGNAGGGGGAASSHTTSGNGTDGENGDSSGRNGLGGHALLADALLGVPAGGDGGSSSGGVIPPDPPGNSFPTGGAYPGGGGGGWSDPFNSSFNGESGPGGDGYAALIYTITASAGQLLIFNRTALQIAASY